MHETRWGLGIPGSIEPSSIFRQTLFEIQSVVLHDLSKTDLSLLVRHFSTRKVVLEVVKF